LKVKVKILNYIFNPTFEFVHIWPKVGLKQPSIFLSVLFLGEKKTKKHEGPH